MAPGIPSPRIPKIQMHNISPNRSPSATSPKKTVTALASLVIADRFEGSNRNEENKHGFQESPRTSPSMLQDYLLLEYSGAYDDTVKTVEQLKEGFKLLTTQLHHVKVEKEASIAKDEITNLKFRITTPPPHNQLLSSTSHNENKEVERSISQLENWSDDEIFPDLEGIKPPAQIHCKNNSETQAPQELKDIVEKAVEPEVELPLDASSRTTSGTYSSEFPYLAPDAAQSSDSGGDIEMQEQSQTHDPVPSGDHKLREYIAMPLTSKISEDFEYLKDEIQFFCFRYIDQEVKENVQNMEVALREGNKTMLQEERERFETSTECLKDAIEESLTRAEQMIIWRVQCEIERVIKTLS